MKNREVARLFRMIALYLEMKGVGFKPQAYIRAADSIEILSGDIEDFVKEKGLVGLETLPGIGQSIANKIIEFLRTGKIRELEKLKKEIPVEVDQLSQIEGLGPKTIFKFYKKLGVRTVADLARLIKKGELRNLEGFGLKSEENIAEALNFYQKQIGRLNLDQIQPVANELIQYLKSKKEIKAVEIVGSYRRRQETIGDLDILVVSKNPDQAETDLVKFPQVGHIYAQGPAKTMVRLKTSVDVDLRSFKRESFGAALLYFTGSKAHNIKLRKIAIKKGLKLNEYGLFRAKKIIAGRTEAEIYRKLGLKFIPPELREDQGEIELAQKNRLPDLVEFNSIKGDLQVQTDWTDGRNSIEAMVEAAIKNGLSYIAITDHTQSLAMTGGADEKKLLKQMAYIDKLNRRLGAKFKILKGAEVNILKDGQFDIKAEVLAKLDFVGAAIHSYFNLSKEDQTKRIIRAMTDPNLDCIFHLTGRIINKRPPINFDFEKVLTEAKKTKTILEINAQPGRLDLNDEMIRRAVKAEVKMIIDSDAHSIFDYQYLNLGVAQARRGWAGKDDILNILPPPQFLKKAVKNK